MPARILLSPDLEHNESFDSARIGLNADRRGESGAANKPSLSVPDAAGWLTRAGLSWSAPGTAAVVTFAFRDTSGPMPLDTGGFSRFTAQQIQATLLALQGWSDVANITFVRQDTGAGYSDNAALLFGNYATGAAGAAAFASLPGSTHPASAAGDVWVNNALSYNATPTLWGYGQLTLVHEIGHAIGLLHPGDYDAAEGVEITYGAHAEYYEDSNQYTVMSYFGESATGANFGSGRYVSAPMLDDIAAAQRLYGANLTTRTGDTVYGFNSTADRPWFSAVAGGPVPVFAVWDAGGTDTLDFSGYTGAQLIDLRQGAFSNVGGLSGNVSIAIGAVIENAIGGSGDDSIIGNSGDNRLVRGAGHDRVDGGLGADTVVFAGPRSAYTISWQTNGAFVSGPDGTCEVENVEFLAFSDMIVATQPTGGVEVSGDITDDFIQGTDHSDTLNGSDGNDVISALDGHDQLNGGRGNDRIDGGAGNDIIYADAGDDILEGGEGVDIIDLSMSITGVVLDLAQGTLSGAHIGTDSVSGFERVVGSRFNDLITGDAGNNYIQAYGGIDIIHGGNGDDELIGNAMEVGGGEDVVKGEEMANGSIQTAVSLDQAFDRLPREGLPNIGSPHATIVAMTHGGVEYYAFTVGANAQVTFDLDGAGFDGVLRVFDSAGNQLAFNDDATYNGDGGSPGDAYLHHRFTTAGVYYVQVSQYASGSGQGVVSAPPPAGRPYTLHVLVADHAVQPTWAGAGELYGDAGNDILRGTYGRDLLDGGDGDDTIFAGSENDIVRGGDGWDTVHVTEWSSECRLVRLDEDRYLLKGPTGADQISGVEVLRFGDGRMLDLARLYATDLAWSDDGMMVDDLLARLADAEAPLVMPPSTAKPGGGAPEDEPLVRPLGPDDLLPTGPLVGAAKEPDAWILPPAPDGPLDRARLPMPPEDWTDPSHPAFVRDPADDWFS